MASRDRSQGIAFVYSDLNELLSKKGEWADENLLPVSKAQTVNFTKDVLFPQEKTTLVPISESPSTPAQTPAQQIQENLDRLQSLHHRIHVMLEELNLLNQKKKKS